LRAEYMVREAKGAKYMDPLASWPILLWEHQSSYM
jgi:hypothetical protein